MKAKIDSFMEAFGMAEYPVLFRYTDSLPEGTLLPPEATRVCVFALLAKTRAEGRPVALSASHHGCAGGGYYLGFLDQPREGIEYFLSCGVAGKMEGERYLKTPDLARAYFARVPARRRNDTACSPGPTCRTSRTIRKSSSSSRHRTFSRGFTSLPRSTGTKTR
ncbi:MAG: DUF169 domain-containing protein [Candidatus Deferrimicrobiaceae bacterium]